MTEVLLMACLNAKRNSALEECLSSGADSPRGGRAWQLDLTQVPKLLSG